MASCPLRMPHRQLSARRWLTVLTLCGLSTAAAWLCGLHAGSSSSGPYQVSSVVSEATDDSSQEPTLSLAPLDIAALAGNFARLKDVVKQLGGVHAPRVDRLMRHRLPVFSTAEWRLSSPEGRQLSVQSVKRAALTPEPPGHPVPNVAHFILPFRESSLQFHHVVSVLSCLHVMRPRLLILWHAPNRLISGKWWATLRSNLTASDWESRVVMATRPLPSRVYSMPVTSAEHLADVMRLEALLTFGGVYLDLDAVVLKPLEPLRRHKVTMGREHGQGLCNGVLLSAPNSSFLAMWHTAYQTFDDDVWDGHSVRLPHLLQRQFPGLCHVEPESLARPSWQPGELQLIYGVGQQSRWNWRARNFVLHLWFRQYNNQHDTESVKRLNSMYGEVCRYILYGTTELL